MRRRFATERGRWIVALGGGLLLAASCERSSLGIRARGPVNVVFIEVPGLSDGLGCLGGRPQAHTPELDRLAERGLVFERAYCPVPRGEASRAAVLLGLAPTTTGIYQGGGWVAGSSAWGTRRTLPRYLRDHGYLTWAAGSVLSGAGRPVDPNTWDRAYPAAGTPVPPLTRRNRHGLAADLNDVSAGPELDWGALDVNDPCCADWQNAGRAVAFLAESHERPFFLAYGTRRPEMPWYAPRSYFEAYPLETVTLPAVSADDLSDVPPAGRRRVEGAFASIKEQGQWRTAARAYLACVSFADACVGRVLEALEASAYRDNTVVVVWADRGRHLGQKGHWGDATLWEEATRTPLIVYVPGLTRKGRRSTRPVSLLDLQATLLALCGLPARSDIEGRSLVPLVKRPTRSWPHPVVTSLDPGDHAVRDGRYRYIHYANGDEELYDHRSDPREWTNLAYRRDHAEIKLRLRQALPVDVAPAVPPPPGVRDSSDRDP